MTEDQIAAALVGFTFYTGVAMAVFVIEVRDCLEDEELRRKIGDAGGWALAVMCGCFAMAAFWPIKVAARILQGMAARLDRREP